MNEKLTLSRRRLFQASVTAAAVSTLRTPGARAAARPQPLKIGMTSYSLRKQSLDQVIALCTEVEIKYLSLKEMHLPLDASPDELGAIRAKIEAAGITITGGGVLPLRNDEAQQRKTFEYARAAKLPLIVGAPSADSLDLVETMIKEYGIPVAIHNHGPEDKNFPSPLDVLAAVKKRDKRLGVCMDVGHTVRAGADPVKCVAQLGDRLMDLHIKDLKDKTNKKSNVLLGLGVVDIVGVFKALAQRRYTGSVALEYEMAADNASAGVRECLAYMRGVAAALV